MSSAFDPYSRWLGIKSEERPPNHYDLLGIKELEDQGEVIRAAAVKRADRIQDIASGGKHMELSQLILNEIASARLCIMNPVSRKSYELSFIKKRSGLVPIADRLEQVEQAKFESIEGADDPLAVVPSFNVETEKKRQTRYVSKRKKRGRTSVLVTAGVYLMVAAGAFKVIQVNSVAFLRGQMNRFKSRVQPRQAT